MAREIRLSRLENRSTVEKEGIMKEGGVEERSPGAGKGLVEQCSRGRMDSTGFPMCEGKEKREEMLRE